MGQSAPAGYQLNTVTMNVLPFPRPSAAMITEPDWSAHLTDPADQHYASVVWNAVVDEMREAGTLSPTNEPEIRRYTLILVMYDRTFAQIERDSTLR